MDGTIWHVCVREGTCSVIVTRTWRGIAQESWAEVILSEPFVSGDNANIGVVLEWSGVSVLGIHYTLLGDYPTRARTQLLPSSSVKRHGPWTSHESAPSITIAAAAPTICAFAILTTAHFFPTCNVADVK